MKHLDAASCRFFTAGDACRLTLDAYRAAGRWIQPPPGEPWVTDGEPYASAGDFVDAFAGELAARLGLLALDRLGTFRTPSDDFDPWVLAERVAPGKMAAIISRRETENAEVDAEFLRPEGHGLPPGDNPGHNQPAREVEDVG